MPMTNDDYGRLTAPGTLVLERLLPGPIERVWAYLTESEKRQRWIAAGEMDLRVGGTVELIFNHSVLSPGEAAPEKYKDHAGEIRTNGEITAVEAPRLLAFSWNEENAEPSEVTFELEEVGNKVKLTLTHRKLFGEEMIAGVAAGWHAHVAIMIDELEGRPRRPFWATHMPLEDEYRTRLFG